jgi:hypothetical protein
MIDRLTPQFVALTYDVALKSFWRKEALRKFLRQCRISEGFLATWSSGESKREFLDRLFAELQRGDKGRRALFQLAMFLVEQEDFPDLQNWEDSAGKIRDASAAVAALKRYVHKQEDELGSRKEREQAQKRFQERLTRIQRSQTDLQKLNSRLDQLSKSLGTQHAGYDFQVWFYDFLDFSELDNRRPYVHEGRQIDGSLTLNGTTYLVELKFTGAQAGAPDIDTFLKKVTDKADNTMGVMVSISGYSEVAKSEASGPRTPLLLLDYSHLYFVLSGAMKLADVVERVRRHASQTGEAFLSPTDF